MAKGYQLIQAQTLTSAVASITFSNIPQNFTDLVIKMSGRSNRAASHDAGINLTFNGVGGTSYSDKFIRGDGSAVNSYSDTSAAVAYFGRNPASSATASTFGNIECYIPNYTSATYKTYSAESVTENNITSAYSELISGLFSNTSAITSITIGDANSSTLAIGSTFYLYGIGGTRATGGTITADKDFTYHTFTSTSTFTALEKIKNAEVLLVAGGGGGGSRSGGGGGAGGVCSSVGQTLFAGTSYTAIVGAGGTAGSRAVAGTNGSNSIFSSLTAAVGGGFGGSALVSTSGAVGGSGGGAGNNGTGSAGTAGQGFAGGSSNATSFDAGGGGGAGGVGVNASPGSVGTGAGSGGVGTNAYHYWHYATSTGVVSNQLYYIAGGGGGGSFGSSGHGSGGLGGGGNGADTSPTAGTANTGGGGGGCGNSANTNTTPVGAVGGSGLVIVRYPNT